MWIFLAALVVVVAWLIYSADKSQSDEDIEFEGSAPTEKEINRYVERLRKRGLSDEDIEYELQVDPESPIVQALSSISSSMTGRKYNPPTREELIADLERSKSEKEYLWETVPSRAGWSKKAEKYLRDEDWEKFDEPGAGPCPDCERRAGRVEAADMWETIGPPGSGWSLCGDDCRCKLILVKETP